MVFAMRRVTRNIVMAFPILLLCANALTAAPRQQQLTNAELLRILRITTMRIRMPQDPRNVWSFAVLRHDQVKAKSSNPRALTDRTGLLSLRDKGDSIYEFTLPEKSGAFSQGDLDLCKETSCAGQYS